MSVASHYNCMSAKVLRKEVAFPTLTLRSRQASQLGSFRRCLKARFCELKGGEYDRGMLADEFGLSTWACDSLKPGTGGREVEESKLRE